MQKEVYIVKEMSQFINEPEPIVLDTLQFETEELANTFISVHKQLMEKNFEGKEYLKKYFWYETEKALVDE